MPQDPQQTLQKIVSGGQTGVDRAALDVAIALGIAHGGWCPRGRLAEDGRIPEEYELQEMASTEYWRRTEQNVIDSDGTLILYRTARSGGTELTHRMTIKHSRPCLCVDLEDEADPAAVGDWICDNGIQVLNVAGPRESSTRGVAEQSRAFLRRALTSPADEES
jgi:hypothetical protein